MINSPKFQKLHRKPDEGTFLQSSPANGAPGAKKGSLPKKVQGFAAELYDLRWLILYFTARQLTQSYRSSFLGIFWIFLGPLLMVALYTLVFSELVGIRFGRIDTVSNYGLYLYCGLIPFIAYSGTVNKAVGIIRQNSALVRRVVFPVGILPLTSTASNLIDQLFGFAALLVLLPIFGSPLHLTILLIPLVMVPQFLFNLGLGYLGAVAGTYLPDLQETVKAVVRVTFFVTPVIWPPELAEEKNLGWLVDYNPVAILVEAYRALVLEGRLPDLAQGLWFTLFSAVLCAAAFWLFTKARGSFGDLV